MEDGLFTKIIKGEIPCHKVYEDEHTLAFLDIHPVRSGHVLVIPKKQIEFVWDLPDDLYQNLMDTVKKVAIRLRKVLPQEYVHEGVVGTDVPHAHVHLIPFDDSKELRHEPDFSKEPDHKALEQMAKKLAF
jgi:histidine triad (HIT) family protein